MKPYLSDFMSVPLWPISKKTLERGTVLHISQKQTAPLYYIINIGSGEVDMENSIARKHPELVSEWSPRNNPLTPDDVAYGSNKLYWWIGPCGHEWQTSAKARSAGEKCPICSNARIIPGINDFKTLYPVLAAEWSEKNAPLEPTQVGPGTHKKVLWHGRCGHEWAAGVRNRVAGAGCPYCSHNIVLPGFNDLQSVRPELAKEWSDRNLPLLPSQVTAFANRKVWWRCSEGHVWNTLISTRSYGSKCPYCSGILTLKGFNDFETMCPEIAREWSDRNGELRPDAVNIKSRQNVWWKCGTCGYEWRSLVKTRVKGARCPVCAARAVLPGYNDLTTTDPDLLTEWDYEKNGEVRPENISRYSMKSVWWKCEFGHSWKDLISHRTIEHAGCRCCQKEFKTVLPQLLIMLYCSQRGLKVELSDEVRLGVLIDAYIPELKLAINTVDARSKREEDTWSITKHLCEKRGLILNRIYINNAVDLICRDVKKIFQFGNVFIISDSTKDIETVWEKFLLLKRKK